ncbi:hypothetical protein Lal_00016041 [Lupinus albus]|nr:hypothetical protein Lal_00016041 [Lupinus albus]
MALIIYFVLFMALCIRHSSASYCLCKDGVDSDELQKALDYACGFGADCGPIQPNGPCFEPNTVKDHCDYAVNSYYQNMHLVGGTCDFAGAATTSPTLPAQISCGCVYAPGPGYANVLFIYFGSSCSDSGTNPKPPSVETPTTPPSVETPTTPSTRTPGTPSLAPPTGTDGTIPDVFGTTTPKDRNDSSNVKGINTKLLLLLILAISWIALRA